MATLPPKVKSPIRRKATRKANPSNGYEFPPIASNAPESLSANLYAIASDPKKATAFLKRAGIITKAGSLAPEYD